MRKLFQPILVLIGILLIVKWFSVEPTAPIKVACIGDSITFGFDIKERNKNSYPAQLAILLGDKWTVINYGVGGATLLKKGDKPYSGLREYKKALEFNPDVVIIKLGTNDSKPVNWMYKNEYIPNYIELIESFRKLPSKPKVWICYPVPVYPESRVINAEIVKNEILPLIDQVAKKEDVKIIDLYTAMSNHRELFAEAVHPNAAGAKKIAETVAAAIRP